MGSVCFEQIPCQIVKYVLNQISLTRCTDNFFVFPRNVPNRQSNTDAHFRRCRLPGCTDASKKKPRFNFSSQKNPPIMHLRSNATDAHHCHLLIVYLSLTGVLPKLVESICTQLVIPFVSEHSFVQTCLFQV